MTGQLASQTSLAAWQAVGLSARFESLEMGEREREQRVVHTVPPCTVEHPTDDVIGLEVYRGEDVPARFRRFNEGCIAVVVWTQFRGKAAK